MWNPCLPGVKPVTLPLTSVYPSSHRRASTNREKRWERTSDGHREYSHTEFERSATGGGVLEEVEGPGDRAVGAAADEGNPFESAGFPCHFSSSVVVLSLLRLRRLFLPLFFRCLSNEPIRPTEKLGCPWKWIRPTKKDHRQLSAIQLARGWYRRGTYCVSVRSPVTNPSPPVLHEPGSGRLPPRLRLSALLHRPPTRSSRVSERER